MEDSELKLHRKDPDFSPPLLEVEKEHRNQILGLLEDLYGHQAAAEIYIEIERLMKVYFAHKTPDLIAADQDFRPSDFFSEEDVILITYGDLLREEGKSPLRALVDTLRENRNLGINTVHLLPFHPYSSDRGFSVVDYREVDPQLGTWDEIEELSLEYKLMFDGVFNHVSSKSRWFQEFLNGNPDFQDFFITFTTDRAIPEDYIRLILRPRTSALLTPFQTLRGRRYVWTTFSPDQVDLNFRNPKVLARILEVLLDYVRRGADLIRLDAVTYMWSELGTSCALLEESHLLVQLFRAVLDVVAPRVILITETNVPHKENVSYFGDGRNEAQMVYNFALPPLVLQAFQTGSSERLTAWAQTLDWISESATYFNFLDSHDGIGLMPVRDILSPAEIEAMIARAEESGALISYRTDASGQKVPYEINTTWFSALNPSDSGESLRRQVDRFLASRSIALSLMGIPGIYLPSLVGRQNDVEAILSGGEARSINRGTLDVEELRRQVQDPASAAHQIFRRFGKLIRHRIESPAFHPNAAQQILRAGREVFVVLRSGSEQTILAVTEVSGKPQSVEIALSGSDGKEWRDILTGEQFTSAKGMIQFPLAAYGVRWLECDPVERRSG